MCVWIILRLASIKREGNEAVPEVTRDLLGSRKVYERVYGEMPP